MSIHAIGVLGLVLVFILVSKILFNKNNKSIASEFLRKYHVPMVALMFLVILIHAATALVGAYSTTAAVSGAVAFLVAVAICVVYGVQKKKGASWLPAHRALAVLLLVIAVIHVILAH